MTLHPQCMKLQQHSHVIAGMHPKKTRWRRIKVHFHRSHTGYMLFESREKALEEQNELLKSLLCKRELELEWLTKKSKELGL